MQGDTDFFVFSPSQHQVTRFLAAFVAAPYIIYKGVIHLDLILLLIGLSTLFYDTVTLYYSIKSVDNTTKNRFYIYLMITTFLSGFLAAYLM